MKIRHYVETGLLLVLAIGYLGWYFFYRVAPWPPQINQIYPDNATFIGSDGKTIHMSTFRGKYVVIHYINPTCPADIGNAASLGQQFERNSDGQEGNDPRIVWLEVLLASLQNTPPHQEDLYEWMKFVSPRRQYYYPTILMISPKLASPRYTAITQDLHGFQLLDRNGVLRGDVTTSHPKHYWPGIVERLSYWLRTNSDNEPLPVPSTKAEPLSDREAEVERMGCSDKTEPDLKQEIAQTMSELKGAKTNHSKARAWLNLQRMMECLALRLKEMYLTPASKLSNESLQYFARQPVKKLKASACPFSDSLKSAEKTGVPLKLVRCGSDWFFISSSAGYQNYLKFWPDGPAHEEAQAALDRMHAREQNGCNSNRQGP